ncbi:MAG: hypothetical protein FJZ56_05825 [Chlamydiae bacterium]|nr:hypothetical protein [Chlamydiota bacterium]
MINPLCSLDKTLTIKAFSNQPITSIAKAINTLVTNFFEQEEKIRQKSNDALRYARLKAEQDSNLLQDWILQSWTCQNLIFRKIDVINS